MHLEDSLFMGKLLAYAFLLILKSYILGTASLNGTECSVWKAGYRTSIPCLKGTTLHAQQPGNSLNPIWGFVGASLPMKKGLNNHCSLEINATFHLSLSQKEREEAYFQHLLHSQGLCPCRASVVIASAGNTALRAQAVVGLKICTSNHKVLRQPAPSLGTFQKPPY